MFLNFYFVVVLYRELRNGVMDNLEALHLQLSLAPAQLSA
jgi:hypothetical protein